MNPVKHQSTEMLEPTPQILPFSFFFGVLKFDSLTLLSPLARSIAIRGYCLGLAFLLALAPMTNAIGQKNRDRSNQTIIKGSLEFDKDRSKSWDGAELTIPFDQLTTQLFEQVELPPVPLPANWSEMTPEQRRTWIQEFEASESGIEFLTERQRRIDNAKVFDVLIEPDGHFVIYDIPEGVYGIQGDVEKEINGTRFAFEVFGQIEVRQGMDEIRLNPIQVAVTPLLQAGQIAPTFALKTLGSNETLKLDDFAGKYLLVSFWMANSPAADYQEMVQAAAAELQSKFPLELLSVSVDSSQADTQRFIEQNKLNLGIHGFAGSFDHSMLFNYGVRSLPTLWLIDPSGKISLSQIDFAIALGQESDLKKIIADRIEGKEPPSVIADREAKLKLEQQQEAGTSNDR